MKQIEQMANSVRYNFDNGLTVSAILDERAGMVTVQTVKITESARSGVRKITEILPNEKLGADGFADYLSKISQITTKF